MILPWRYLDALMPYLTWGLIFFAFVDLFHGHLYWAMFNASLALFNAITEAME